MRRTKAQKDHDSRQAGWADWLRRWWIVGALFLVGSLVLIPVVQVGLSRWVNPAVTPEMLRFQLFSKNEDAGERGLQYRWIPLEKIPREQIHLIWASEDQRFFDHAGIDLDEIREALMEAEIEGGKPRGASTITMQAARCMYLWQGRSWLRKGLETYYTLLMELMLSKRRILELYLNVIEFGEGVYGVRAAAEVFYDREPDKLTKDQMAMIAAVMPSPKQWDPTEPTPRLLNRQKRVLRLTARSRFPWSEIEGGRAAGKAE